MAGSVAPPPMAASRPSAAFSTIALLAIRMTRWRSSISRNACARIPCSQECRCMESAASATFSNRLSLTGAARLGRATPSAAPLYRKLRRFILLLSMQNRARDGVASRVQNFDTRNGLHGFVIGKGPDHALVPRDLDDVGGLAELAVSQPVSHDRVAIRQPVQAGHELQADAGQLLAAHLPDGSPIRRGFEHARGGAIAVGAGDERVAIRQTHGAVRAARRRH